MRVSTHVTDRCLIPASASRTRRSPPPAALSSITALALPSPLRPCPCPAAGSCPTRRSSDLSPERRLPTLPSPPAIPARRELAQWPRERVARSASASLLRPPALGPLR